MLCGCEGESTDDAAPTPLQPIESLHDEEAAAVARNLSTARAHAKREPPDAGVSDAGSSDE